MSLHLYTVPVFGVIQTLARYVTCPIQKPERRNAIVMESQREETKVPFSSSVRHCYASGQEASRVEEASRRRIVSLGTIELLRIMGEHQALLAAICAYQAQQPTFDPAIFAGLLEQERERLRIPQGGRPAPCSERCFAITIPHATRTERVNKRPKTGHVDPQNGPFMTGVRA
jgi:hypothetical protein